MNAYLDFDPRIDHPASIHIALNNRYTNVDSIHPATFQILTIKERYESNKRIYNHIISKT
jgi:hypothetical protein